MIEIELKNFDKLINIAEKFPAIAETHINKAINRALVRVFGAEKIEAPFGVTGNLRDRWELNVGRFQGVLRSQMPYALAVHEGSRPHFVAPEKLMAWARNKGLNPYAVSHSIRAKGTKANPFFQRAVSKTERDVQKEFKDALVLITKEIGN